MILLIVALVGYNVFAKRVRFLPHIPFGLLILYLVVRFVWLLIHNQPFALTWEKWIHLIATALLGFALIRLFFALVVDGIRKLFGKLPLPQVTRDAILMVCYAIVAFILLRTRGNINLTGLITSTAVLTAVIGLAAQNTLSSFLGGLTLQMERPFSIGDWIEFGDVTGEVAGITWKTTQLVTREDEMIFIPNAEISKTIFRNFSRPTKRHVARLEIGVSYDAAPSDVRTTILRVLSEHPDVLATPAPQVRLTGFGDSAITYQIRFWHEQYGDEPRIKAEINNHLWYALRRAGISIPFPIRDVHMAHEERAHQQLQRDAENKHVLALLRGVEILSPLSEEQCHHLSHHITRNMFGDGERIVRQGDPGDSLSIVVKGQADILLESSRGETLLATVDRGGFFGEMSLLTGEPRRATVRAKGDAHLLSIDKEAFQTIVTSHPTISERFAEILAKRQAELSGKQADQSRLETKSQLLAKIKSFFGVRHS